VALWAEAAAAAGCCLDQLIPPVAGGRKGQGDSGQGADSVHKAKERICTACAEGEAGGPPPREAQTRAPPALAVAWGAASTVQLQLQEALGRTPT